MLATEAQQEKALRQEVKLSRQILNETPRLWWALWCHRNKDGRQLNFTKNHWLHAIYQDNADRIVIPKSSKTFITEWLLCDMLTLAMKGLNGMYILPDQPIRNRFITSRLDPVLRNLTTLNVRPKEVDKAVDEKGLKTLFNSTWAFVGAKNPDTFYEFTADALIVDEFDKCNPISLTLSTDRALAATKEIWRRVGNPSYPGFGIAKEYAQSDQKVWMVKCEHCNQWQELDWFVHFVEQIGDVDYHLRDESFSLRSSPGGRDIYPLCRQCHKPFDRCGDGQWVVAKANSLISGYRVSRLSWQPIEQSDRPPMLEMFDVFIKALHNQTELQLFYNNRLGLPYTGTGSRIDENILAGCVQADYQMPLKAESTCGGVDIGNQLHVNISKIENGKRRKVYIGTAINYEDLDRLCRHFGVKTGVMDAGPEIHEPREFCRRHPGWYLCRYNKAVDEKIEKDGKQGDWFACGDFRYNPTARLIAANRTESLDIGFDEYLSAKVVLPHDWQTVDNGDFVKQMMAPIRVKRERPDGTFCYIWTKDQADHHRHSDNYERMAAILQNSNMDIKAI